ncbi:unnamed protein product [Discosporangium mesarthrocarpum]
MILKDSLLAGPSTHEASKFRRRLRWPFPFYKKLVEECKRERWFGRLGSGDAGELLGKYRDVSGIHESTVQACFHTLCKNFAKGVCKTWISAPEGEDLKEVTATYAGLGFPDS